MAWNFLIIWLPVYRIVSWDLGNLFHSLNIFIVVQCTTLLTWRESCCWNRPGSRSGCPRPHTGPQDYTTPKGKQLFYTTTKGKQLCYIKTRGKQLYYILRLEGNNAFVQHQEESNSVIPHIKGIPIYGETTLLLTWKELNKLSSSF